MGSGSSRSPWVAEVIIGLFFVAVLLYKAKLMRPAAHGSVSFAIVQHDAAILALMLLLYSMSFVTPRWRDAKGTTQQTLAVVGRMCGVGSLFILFLYLLDALIYKFFVTRLYVRDAVTFFSERNGVFSLVYPAWRVVSALPLTKLVVGGVVLVLLSRACYAILDNLVRRPLRGFFLAGTAILLMTFSLVPIPSYVYSFPDKPLYENVIERNASFFVNSNFSDGFRDRILAAPSPTEVCKPGRNQRVNVVLLIVESLSAYHSRFFSGVEDWTPRLDNIARQETSLTNFHANGWTTIGGLLSLLGGTFPLVPEHTAFNEWGSPRLTDFTNLPRPLPRLLRTQGYTTEFVAAGDLSFLGQDQWLKTIGFEKLVGGDDDRFAPVRVRGPFHAVPDRVLYDAALGELAKMPANKPYFLVVQTFWSHRPFIDQNGGKLNGEEDVIRESDTQIDVFYQRLATSGFFQNGLLFITGDHRAAEPFRKEEFKRFGSSAVERIPAVMVTRAIQLPRVLDQDFQQRDFRASIEALVDNQYCLEPQEGSFLSDPPSPPSCIIHAQGDDRDLVFVKCGPHEAVVRTSGDSTRVISGYVPNEVSLIDTINRTRARKIDRSPQSSARN